MVTTLKYKIKNITGIVASVYHSPNSNHNEFLNVFYNWINKHILNEQNICIFGDINIDWLKDSTLKRKAQRNN